MRYFMILLVVILCGCDETQGYWESDSGSDSDSDSDSDTDGDIDTDCSGDGICDDPPDSFCSEDGTQFIEYTGEATCTVGECNYSTIVHDCTADEWEGDCVIDSIDNEAKCNDPCVNFDCSWAAIPHCNSDNTVLKTIVNPQCTFNGPDTDDIYCGWGLETILEDCPNGCVVIEDGPDYCQE